MTFNSACWKFLTFVVFVSMLDLCTSASEGQTNIQNRNRVSVIALDSFGKSFGDFTVTSFVGENKREFRDLFKGATAEGVPLGSYWMTIRLHTGGQMNEKVVIDRPDCLLVISRNPFNIDYPNGRAPILRGQIKNQPQAAVRFTWVKMCGLFISGCAVSEIDQGGRFSFLNLTPAAYVVEFLDASGGAVIDRIEIEDPGESITADPSRPAGERLKVQERQTPRPDAPR